MNIAALAQFKHNQQQELARKLQGNAPETKGGGHVGKHGKNQADAPLVIAKPAMIKAQNRTFTTKFVDARKSNMR